MLPRIMPPAATQPTAIQSDLSSTAKTKVTTADTRDIKAVLASRIETAAEPWMIVRYQESWKPEHGPHAHCLACEAGTSV